MNLINDVQIAKHIDQWYHWYLEETGARSLADAVEKEISDNLAAEFF